MSQVGWIGEVYLVLSNSTSKITVVDYGTGNLNSISRVLGRIGADVHISSTAGEISRAEKIILPGVGHFGKAMGELKELDLTDALHEAVLVKRVPVLGICLGLELMASTSEEGNASGLGWLNAQVVRFDISSDSRHKIPHMGWNQVHKKRNSALMEGIEESSEFYFAHSYYLNLDDPLDLLTETTYSLSFPSAIEKGNIFGVQYHPEKSHDAGVKLLKNFVEL
jgi:glutamine amidotransferase